jgi:hypothetical protein
MLPLPKRAVDFRRIAMGANSKTGFIVPAGIAQEEIKVLADALQEAVPASGSSLKGNVELIEVRARGVVEGPGTMEMLLLLSGGAGAWFTKKWADEYLWPIIKRKLDRPSKALTEWLGSIVTSSTSDRAEPC